MTITRQTRPEELEKVSTKVCPKCSNENLLLLRTFNYKQCTDCGTRIPWYLEEKQKPLC